MIANFKTVDEFIKEMKKDVETNNILVRDFNPYYEDVKEAILTLDSKGIKKEKIYHKEGDKIYCENIDIVEDRCFSKKFIRKAIDVYLFRETRYTSRAFGPEHMLTVAYMDRLTANAKKIDPNFEMKTLEDHFSKLLMVSLEYWQQNRREPLISIMAILEWDMPFLTKAYLGYSEAVRQLVDKFKE